MLGVVGLMLFVFPVLSVPLGGAGLVFGCAGLVLAAFGGWASLPWSIGGIVLSGLALAISLALAQNPTNYLPTQVIPLDTQPVPTRYVPPPARLGRLSEARLRTGPSAIRRNGNGNSYRQVAGIRGPGDGWLFTPRFPQAPAVLPRFR